jgi:hypothetical protein
MKELKFRVFDSQYKIMSRNYKLGENSFKGLDESLTVMQYTGLKDSTKWEELTKEEQQTWLATGKDKEEWNGKEIYEGDIITAMFEKILPAVVVENHGAFRLKRPDRKTLKYIGNKVDRQLTKIIGNIYQNPELLKNHNE